MTRRLCIAVLLDSRVRDSVIPAILHNRFRAVAHSPGVDLATVLKYALVGQKRQTVRDAALAVPIALFVGILFSRAYHLLPAPILLTWLVVFLEMYGACQMIVFPHLTRDFYDPAEAPLPNSPEMRERLTDIADRDTGNITVFAGYSPFIGYGATISSWSFTMNVARAEEGEQVVPFTAGDLHDRVAAGLRDLGLPGLTVEDRLFVNGLDLRHDGEPDLRSVLLPEALAPPVSRVSERFLRDLRDDPLTRARPYLTATVTGWEGDMVISIFLRFALLAEKGLLFVEASCSLLPPLRDGYHAIDRLFNCSATEQLARIAVSAAGRAVGAPFLALPHARKALFAPRDRGRKHDVEGGTYNYGAAYSLREHAADTRYHRYFQRLDKEMYVKAAEQRVMNTLTDFLVEHHVDVSDLREHRTTILNNGIFVTGRGQVHSQSVAAGAGAVARAERGGDRL
ncbi:hypothetical protein [Nonomuraea sp. NPDC050643]|uniref:hypothetical protein n=1 Tax=Nonomuraea sp. NPDC050643 TaxID=3155660 RepID=UPI0033D615F5